MPPLPPALVPAIQLTNVSKHDHTYAAVTDVNLSVGTGEVIGFLA